MRPNSDQSENKRSRYAFNLTLAAITGQVGCLTVVIVLAALFGGLWLDNNFRTERPIFTIILMIASVPVTVVGMLWLVRTTTAKIQSAGKKSNENHEEGMDSG